MTHPKWLVLLRAPQPTIRAVALRTFASQLRRLCPAGLRRTAAPRIAAVFGLSRSGLVAARIAAHDSLPPELRVAPRYRDGLLIPPDRDGAEARAIRAQRLASPPPVVRTPPPAAYGRALMAALDPSAPRAVRSAAVRVVMSALDRAPTKVAAAQALRISRPTLDLVLQALAEK